MKTDKAINEAWNNSSGPGFIKMAKKQMAHLTAHYGVKKSELFVYSECERRGPRRRRRSRWRDPRVGFREIAMEIPCLDANGPARRIPCGRNATV